MDDDGSLMVQANPGWYLLRYVPGVLPFAERTGIIAWRVWAGSGEPIVEHLGVKKCSQWGRGVDWAVEGPDGKVTSDLGHFWSVDDWLKERQSMPSPKT